MKIKQLVQKVVGMGQSNPIEHAKSGKADEKQDRLGYLRVIDNSDHGEGQRKAVTLQMELPKSCVVWSWHTLTGEIKEIPYTFAKGKNKKINLVHFEKQDHCQYAYANNHASALEKFKKMKYEMEFFAEQLNVMNDDEFWGLIEESLCADPNETYNRLCETLTIIGDVDKAMQFKLLLDTFAVRLYVVSNGDIVRNQAGAVIIRGFEAYDDALRNGKFDYPEFADIFDVSLTVQAMLGG